MSDSQPLLHSRPRTNQLTYCLFISLASLVVGILTLQVFMWMSQLVEYNRKMTQNTYLMCNMTKSLTNWEDHESLQCIF